MYTDLNMHESESNISLFTFCMMWYAGIKRHTHWHIYTKSQSETKIHTQMWLCKRVLFEAFFRLYFLSPISFHFYLSLSCLSFVLSFFRFITVKLVWSCKTEENKIIRSMNLLCVRAFAGEQYRRWLDFSLSLSFFKRHPLWYAWNVTDYGST